MEFYTKFQWAVPHAFSDAVNSCRFEEGDVLFDNPNAYGDPWSESKTHFQTYIQVVFPPKSAGRGAGQVFKHNWNSTVRFDQFGQDGRKERVTTTQGRLYTALWRGDFKLLDSKPEMPLGVKDIPKKGVSKASLEDNSPQAPFFVMAVDHSSELLLTKKRHVHIALKSHLAHEPRVIGLHEIGLPNWDRFAPTIDLVLFETPSISKDKLHSLIKSVVYKPQKDAKADRYRIAAHGWIFGKTPIQSVLKQQLMFANSEGRDVQKLDFLVQGSATDPYTVTFTIEGNNLNAYCTCPAGHKGQYCKHRFCLLAGDTRKLVGENVDEVQTLLKWLVGSDVESAIEEVHRADMVFLDAKKKLAKAKKNVAVAMRL